MARSWALKSDYLFFSPPTHVYIWWLIQWRIHLQCRRPGFNPQIGKIPWRRALATHSHIPAWRISMNRGAWWAAVHGVAKSQTRLTKHIYIFTTYRKLSCILSLLLNLWSRQVSTVHSHEVVYFYILIHKSAGERLQRHTCPLPEACRCHKQRQDRIDSQILSARSLCPLQLACPGLSCLIL